MLPIQLGLRENLGQFSLLVLVNAFVGAMVGLERTVLPLLAANSFGLASRTAILSFIISFGLAKAATNYFSGVACDRLGHNPREVETLYSDRRRLLQKQKGLRLDPSPP